MKRRGNRLAHGFTITEILIVITVIAVLTAVAVPMWRTHALRVKRTEAKVALIGLQGAQDKYFGTFARYALGSELTTAAPNGLGLADATANGYYRIALRTAPDGLAYVATAIAAEAQSQDTRCVELSIDQVGRRRAIDVSGADRSADCWH